MIIIITIIIIIINIIIIIIITITTIVYYIGYSCDLIVFTHNYWKYSAQKVKE